MLENDNNDAECADVIPLIRKPSGCASQVVSQDAAGLANKIAAALLTALSDHRAPASPPHLSTHKLPVNSTGTQHGRGGR